MATVDRTSDTPRPSSATMPAWHHAISEYVQWAHLTESTARKRRSQLVRYARESGHPSPWQSTAQDIAAWLDRTEWGEATRRAHRVALREFYRWARQFGHITTDVAGALAHPTHNGRGTTGPAPLDVPEVWAIELAAWQRYARIAGRPETSIELHSHHLRRFAREVAPVGPWDVTIDHLIEWLHTAGKRWSNETRRSHRTTFRMFYAWAVETGRSEDNPAMLLPTVKVAPPLPRPATEDAYRFALVATEPRVRLMVRLSAELGMRRAEVAQVHSRDLVDSGTGLALLVHGKGDKKRVLPLPASLSAELCSLPPGYAFPGDYSGHLSPAYVGKLVSRALPVGVTMHALRHRFATRAYGIDRDLFAVQQLLGHASPETTRRYVRIDDDATRRLVDSVAELSHSRTARGQTAVR
ncbi:tyrosine-type recombinase/integrase [Rhodococcus aetherivorans]|uniref:tyrosine-type recombinase/integrase n=1 Tax=Rhodococcus aetherivorans TaxID=191292 RepID=UPI000AD13422|nr:tyrosine-type recombinase/integrase [Rhodococcus aetherivorans]MDV6296987.1 tyrosine-type recombinase/integrase [Rhodococcus aetherivorans]